VSRIFSTVKEYPYLCTLWWLPAWVYDSSLGGVAGSMLFFWLFQVEVSATGRSLDWRSPTECGVSECDLENSTMRRPWPTSNVKPLKKWKKNYYPVHKTSHGIRMDPEEFKIHLHVLRRETDFNISFSACRQISWMMPISMPSKSFPTHYSWAVFSTVSVLLEASACFCATYGEQLTKFSRNIILYNFTKIGIKCTNLDKIG